MIFGIKHDFLAAAAECADGGFVCADVAFAARQIKQLPFVFCAGAGLLALFFECEVFLCTGRRFAKLPLSIRRKRWLAWQQSPMAAKRDFAVLCRGLMFFSRFSRSA